MQGSVKESLPRLRDRVRSLRFAPLREAVAESTAPALVRGNGTSTGSEPAATTTETAPTEIQCPSCKGSAIKVGMLCPRCSGSGTIPTGTSAAQTEPASFKESQRSESAPSLVRLHPTHQTRLTRIREATATKGPIFEVELVAEGMGNERDRVFYTKQALREAATSGVLEGMQAYANHPGKDEEINRPERDVRELVGYYRGFKFRESGSEGKPVVAAELVVNQGDSVQWFVDLLESAISAKDDGVQLCGISIDGGGLVELGEIDGRYINVCREITEAPSADIVTRPAAGGTIVRRLRESVQRAQLPTPQEPAMKTSDLKSKLTAVHTSLRESVAKLTAEGATDEHVAAALTGINAGIQEVETLAGTEIEAEVQIREAQVGDKTATALAAELETTRVKLREAETENTTLKGENTTLNRSMLAAQALREAEVPVEDAKLLFGDLVKLDSLDAMKGHIEGEKAREERIFNRFRESYGLGQVEGAAPRVPTPVLAPAGSDRLESMGIPVLPEPAPAAA